MGNDLYLPAGWVNAARLVDAHAPFVVAVGGRGVGKTYGVLRLLLERGARFIYLRRSQSQIDACKVPELMPFAAVCRDTGIAVNVKALSKYVCGFYRADAEQGAPAFCVGVALSTFANIRGFDGSGFDHVVFDEFIPESHERRTIAHEGEAFLNVLETVGRNRELQGRGELHTILLANANKFDSPILDAIGATSYLDRMIRRGQEWGRYLDGDLEIYHYINSAVSEAKASTALYRVAKSRDFVNMAIANAFSADTYKNVGTRPLQEFYLLVSAAGLSIYEHKANNHYYVVEGERGEDPYGADPASLRAFRRRFIRLLYAADAGRVQFATAPAKIQFYNLWRD